MTEIAEKLRNRDFGRVGIDGMRIWNLACG